MDRPFPLPTRREPLTKYAQVGFTATAFADVKSTAHKYSVTIPEFIRVAVLAYLAEVRRTEENGITQSSDATE